MNKCSTPSTSTPEVDGDVEVVPLELTSRSEEQRKKVIREAWRTFIETTGRLHDELDKVLREGAGIAIADYNLFVLLSEAPDHRLRFKDLAKRMLFSKSRLSYQVKVLDKRGLVCRRAAEEDARGLYVELTEEGMKTYMEAAKLHSAQVKALMLDSLTFEEAEVLQRVFTRVAANIEELCE